MMRKYLMTGLVAVALSGLFSSCSKDIETGEVNTGEINILQTYENAFVTRFGQPAENQDWGFGEVVAGTRSRAGIDYVLTEQNPTQPNAPAQPTYRSQPTAPTFSTTVPANTPKATKDNWNNGNVFYIDNDAVDLENPQNKEGVTIYANGNNVTYSYQTNQNGNGTKFIVTENSKLTLTQVGNNLSVYLAPNATLVVPDGATFKNSTAMLYMSSGSTVKGGNNLTFEANYVVFNDGGTLDVQTVTVDGGALLYNKGTLKAATSIVLKNTDGELVNNGTITSPSFDQRAGGKFLNDEAGVVTISGMTYLTNTNCVWQNKGDYTTQNVDIENTRRVYNNCKMTVTDTFHFIKNSAFVLDGHASVKTAKMIWDDDCDFYMKDESLLWVEGQLLAKNDDKGYGAIALGSGYSIIKAGSIDYESGKQSRMNYWGKIYVDTQTHFPQGFDDPSNKTTGASQPHYYFSTQNKTVMFRFLNDACPITSSIAAGKCHHGYNPPDNPPTPPSGFICRIIAEDLTVGENSDFDFNDVVFDVINGGTTIRLRAAGGELPLYVAGKEVHDEFAKKYPGITRKTLVNTGWKGTLDYDNYYVDIPSGDTYSTPALANNITVIVTKMGKDKELVNIELTARTGKVASKVCVGYDYKWCSERQDIDAKFHKADGTKLFHEYVVGHLGNDWKNGNAWYQQSGK